MSSRTPHQRAFPWFSPPEKNAGLLVIDLRGKDRYVFVLTARENLVLINENLPRVFVVPKKGLEEFFKALAENDLERLTDKGLRRKGKKWRFLIDAAVTSALLYLENYIHLGFWTGVILAIIFAEVEYFFGPKKG